MSELNGKVRKIGSEMIFRRSHEFLIWILTLVFSKLIFNTVLQIKIWNQIVLFWSVVNFIYVQLIIHIRIKFVFPVGNCFDFSLNFERDNYNANLPIAKNKRFLTRSMMFWSYVVWLVLLSLFFAVFFCFLLVDRNFALFWPVFNYIKSQTDGDCDAVVTVQNTHRE